MIKEGEKDQRLCSKRGRGRGRGRGSRAVRKRGIEKKEEFEKIILIHFPYKYIQFRIWTLKYDFQKRKMHTTLNQRVLDIKDLDDVKLSM